MAATVDFQSVMSELTDFQNALGRIHANLTNVKNKEILGDMLDKMSGARTEVEVEYPKAMNLIDETARTVKAESQAELAKLAEERAQREQEQATIEAAKPKAALSLPKPEAKVDPALGLKLRAELLERFGPGNDSADVGRNRIREAWQDWD